MFLAPGDAAPDFTLFASTRQPWTLADQRGRPVLLLFFPGAFSSGCTTELNEVSNDIEQYAPALVVGISTDSPFVLAEFAKVNRFTFALLSDHEAAVSAAYGAKFAHDFMHMKLDRISRRAVFLIDAAGTIRHAEVLADEELQPDLAAARAALATL